MQNQAGQKQEKKQISLFLTGINMRKNNYDVMVTVCYDNTSQ